MRSRSHSAQHDAAVARRLELLTTELAGVRVRGRDDPHPIADSSTVAEPASRSMPYDDLPAYVDLPDLGRPGGVAGVDSPPSPVVARMPGRHASRRGSAPGLPAVRDLVPESVRGQVGLGPGQVAVVALLVAMGLAVTCWWLVRGDPHVEAAPTRLRSAAGLTTPDALDAGGTVGAAGSPPAGAAAGSQSPVRASARVVVDVAGKVRHPGIAVLSQGARVIDAVHAAGGARPGVDLAGLNLARVLTDGEQIVVGSVAVPGGPTDAPSPGAPVGGLVDINTADQTVLESLPDVGPVTAQAILTWRAQHGGFSSVDQLLDVDGIGDATLAKLKPYVTV